MGMKQTPAGLVVGLILDEESAPAPVSQQEEIVPPEVTAEFPSAKRGTRGRKQQK